MKALTFWKAVTVDREEFLERLLDVLNAGGVRYCVIGGQGVNAYAEPMVSLDLDLAVAADQLDAVETALARQFVVERFGHSIKTSLRPIQTSECKFNSTLAISHSCPLLRHAMFLACCYQWQEQKMSSRIKSGPSSIRPDSPASGRRIWPILRDSWRCTLACKPRYPKKFW